MAWHWFPEGHEGLIAQLRRATVLKTDDSGSQQILKKLRGLASEMPEDIYRPQPHGFSSHAPQGSEGLFLALGGRSDRLLALGFEHKDKRPRNLPEGGVALYDADGKLLKIVKDGTEYDAGKKPVTIRNATKIKIEGADDVAIGVNGRWVRIRPARVDLGVSSPDGEADAKVLTEAGPSDVVWAKV